MKSLPDYLRSIKEVLLYAYIWQIPFSWRIIFDPSRSTWNTKFNEYMDIALYIGEIFIVFALLIHILEYIISNKSIYNDLKSRWRKMFHVEHGLPYLFTIGIILLSINTLASIDSLLSLISILHFFSVIVFMFLFFNLYVSRGTKFIQNVFFILLISLIIQLLIAFFQVLNSVSIGLGFLNEPQLSLGMENVAKSNIFSNISLRAYGTSLHPNILAAYALMIAVFSIYIHQTRLFHVKHYLKMLILTMSISTVVLTQSKIALIFIFLILIWYLNEKFKLFHVKQLVKLAIIVIFVGISGFFFLNSDAEQSFYTRIDQFNLQSKITLKEFFIGSGIGTYRLSYDRAAAEEWWNYEPVHFVPMIVFKELGVFLFIGIVISIRRLIVSVPRETLDRLSIVIAFILFVVTTDHFSWDIYQGTAVLSIAIVLLYIDKYTILYHNMINKKRSEIGE